MPHSLTHCTHSITYSITYYTFSQAWQTGYSYSIIITSLVEMLRIWDENPFTILNTYVYILFSYSFGFDPSLWWPLLLSMAAIRGYARTSTLHNNAPQRMKMFPDSVTSWWHLSVHYNKELTELVLELLEMVYILTTKKEAWPIHRLKSRVALQQYKSTWEDNFVDFKWEP